MNPLLGSVTAMFPCYNDAATIVDMVARADAALTLLGVPYEIVVVDDGSGDDSRLRLEAARAHYPSLKLVFHERNRGYGGALRSGFAAATSEWVFYTDGDGQYDPGELTALAAAVTPDIDVVNGFKIARQDSMLRKVVGRLYRSVAVFMFGLPIRDIDCDFRLMRRDLVQKAQLSYDSGIICVELVKKLERQGARFKEIPVHHFARLHGQSQFFRFPRLVRTGRDYLKFWLRTFVFSR